MDKYHLTTEETRITEIELLPDGRICLFGASEQVLELLDAAGLADSRLRQRLALLGASVSREPQHPGRPAEVVHHVQKERSCHE